MSGEVYTPEAISHFIYESNIRGLISLCFGLFSIFAIIRYTTHKSMNEYKFHLLNMASWILMCDLTLTVFCRPYPTMPLQGGCLVGELNGVFINFMSVDLTFYVVGALEIFMLLSSMAAVCNATIHRYVFVSNLVNQRTKTKYNFHIYILMFIVQIVWPLIAVLVCLNIDLKPKQALELNQILHPELLKRMSNKPCIILWTDLKAIYEQYLPTTLVFLNGIFCGIGSFLTLLFCWQKMLNARFGKLSERTIKMQRKLLITLGFQTLLPNIAYLGCALTLSIGMLSGIKSTEYFANHIFLYVSAHSVLNFIIMFTTIPTFYKGLFNDLKHLIYVISCGAHYQSKSSILSISKVYTTTNARPNGSRIFKKTN